MKGELSAFSLPLFLNEPGDINIMISQVTYGKDLLINMQKLVFRAYLLDFTSEKSEN